MKKSNIPVNAFKNVQSYYNPYGRYNRLSRFGKLLLKFKRFIGVKDA